MQTGEALLKSSEEWDRWLEETFQDILGSEEEDGREEMRKEHSPTQYPCIVIWAAVKSRYDWFRHWFVYPADFSPESDFVKRHAEND